MELCVRLRYNISVEQLNNRDLAACKVMLRKVMLRNCKADVVVIGSGFCYIEITKLPKSKEDFIMELSDKIIKHRKANGWSQEDFAEKLNIS